MAFSFSFSFPPASSASASSPAVMRLLLSLDLDGPAAAAEGVAKVGNPVATATTTTAGDGAGATMLTPAKMPPPPPPTRVADTAPLDEVLQTNRTNEPNERMNENHHTIVSEKQLYHLQWSPSLSPQSSSSPSSPLSPSRHQSDAKPTEKPQKRANNNTGSEVFLPDHPPLPQLVVRRSGKAQGRFFFPAADAAVVGRVVFLLAQLSVFALSLGHQGD